MKIFVDTSSLFKLYHKEKGTDELWQFLKSIKIEKIYLAETTKLEFDSIVFKKVRMKDVKLSDAKILISQFEKDYGLYEFIAMDNSTLQLAKNLINKHGVKGVRALDALQITSAMKVKNHIEIYISSDILMNEIFVLEKLKILQ